ncbi:MAG TPA: redox-sensitive transcriptional activator SoxR [Pseudonocardiaceae bacterium]|nr:redox-sensitive transcriptional activator SoxR [Pseudonocardiaceae bacterium]
MTHGELTVGQLAARSGVSISALHFYERQGLISSRRTSGNQRRYQRKHAAPGGVHPHRSAGRHPAGRRRRRPRLLPDNRTPTRRDWQRISQCWQDTLDQRMRQLQQLRDDFTDCVGCGCLSIDRCKLANPFDELGKHGPGPRRLLGQDREGAQCQGGAGGCGGADSR